MKNLLVRLVGPAALVLLGCASAGHPVPHPADVQPTFDAAAPSRQASAKTTEERAGELLLHMTLDEKLAYVGGEREFYIRAIPRLGIPEIKMADGPAGCRNWGPNTAYPAAIGLAASFDATLAERVGRGIGRDCRARGVHLLLAPGVNIQRSPLAGRNFEYLGEDPFLAGKTASAFIRGLKSEGVLATVKHFAGNNQEWDRTGVSSEIDERTLREIYLPAFERAVREGQVAAVMTAYNLLNGTYCSHHSWLLRTVLKQEWGFSGIVMSDWGAVHDAEGAANGGLDLEMPSAIHMNPAHLSALIEQKKLDASVLDDKVRRILRTIVGAGFLDRAQKRDDIPLDDPSSRETALDAARQSLVLLKNAGPLLPLDRTSLRRIAVLGPNASPLVHGGSGSAFVTPLHAVSLLQGLEQAAPGVQISHHPGVRQPSELASLGKPCFAAAVTEQVFVGRELAGRPVATRSVDRVDYRRGEGEPSPGGTAEDYSIRWAGALSVKRAGRYRITESADDGIRIYLDKKPIIEDWTEHGPKIGAATVPLQPGEHALVIEYYQGKGGAVAQFGFAPERTSEFFEGGDEVSALAKAADVVVVSVGYGQSAETNSIGAAYTPFWPPGWARHAGIVESEDSDRPFELPAAQIETIRLAVAANPRTIVVVNAGGAVDLRPFLGGVPALLWAWYPGQEGARALAEVLFGDVSPSGKLPVTFGKAYADYPSALYYNLKRDNKTPYSEGVFVGYRGFDRNQIEPAFAFGYGLSFTTFAYEGLETTQLADGSARVTCQVTNAGKRAGSEIVEVYVAPPPASVPRPPQELKGYARVSLEPGEKKQISLSLEPRSFAFWDDPRKKWVVEAGSFEVRVGASSRDIRLRSKLEVTAREMAP